MVYSTIERIIQRIIRRNWINWIILPIDQHTKKRELSGGILDKLDNSLVDEHTKKKNYPDKSLDNSFLGEIYPDKSEPYCILLCTLT